MGFSFTRTRNSGSVTSGFQIWILLLVFSTCSLALNFTAVKEATLNLDDLGRVGLGGDFNSVAMYQYEEQNSPSYNADGTHSVIVELPNGQFASLAKTNGVINDMCTFVLKNGKTAGLIVGGNFTQIGGVDATGVALLNPDTGKVVTLAGLTGTVNTLLCDKDIGTVFVGGDFTGGSSTNAISWVGMVGWANMPFAGFNGPVNSIQKTSNGSIIFGGQFSSIGNDSMTVGGKGSEDSPKNNQFMNLGAASVTSQLSSSEAGFNDPKSIVCGGGSDGPGKTWLLQDGTYGSWSAEFQFIFVPTFIRLSNTHLDGRGTKTFSLISRPNNGIMNLTYTDPATKEQKFCDANCPMSDDPNVPFQDYHLVNPVPMNAFDLHIWSFYGKGAGLNGLQIFSRDQQVFADNGFNEPACANVPSPSGSTKTGTWTTVGNKRAIASYLMGNFTGSELDTASVTFKPDIKRSGKYVVNLYTPGCEWDFTCATRGSVTVKGIFTKDQTEPKTVTVSQTNPDNKYDPIFTVQVDASDSSFTPSITLAPVPGQTGMKTVVAQKLNFVLQGGSSGSSGSGSNGSNGSGSGSGDDGSDDGSSEGDSGLGGGVVNGVFEYNPNTVVQDNTDIPDNAVISSGSLLDDNAVTNSILVAGDTIFIGGNFTGDGIANIYSVNNDGVQKLPNGGLNGAVITMKQGNDKDSNTVFIGGDFTNTANGDTAGLSHVAGYDTKGNKWFSLGAGLDGKVDHIVPLQMNFSNGLQWTYVFSGEFTKILASGGHPETTVSNMAIWIPSNSTWMEWLDNPPIVMEGTLSASSPATNGLMAFYGGNFIAAIGGTAGAVSLFNDPVVIESLGIRVDHNSTIPPRVAKRDTAVLNDKGITCGTFYTESKSANWTIIGGKFTAKGASGTVRNLAMIDANSNNKVTGITGGNLDESNVYKSLLVSNHILWAGGAVSGKINNTDVGGIFGWDLSTSSLLPEDDQPAALTGTDVAVYTITNKPSSDFIFVGGSFTQAGGNPCNGLCYFDSSKAPITWLRPGSGFSGTIYVSDWIKTNTLLLGGEMQINGSTVYMVTYDFNSQQWTLFGNSAGAKIPGPVKDFTTADEDGTTLYASGQRKDGTSFLMYWDGSKWTDVFGSGLENSSEIRDVQVLNIRDTHSSNEYMANDRALLVTGNMQMKNIPLNVSAALFDGSKWAPFLLTTGGAGESSSIGPFFSQFKPNFKKNSKHLAIGLVVLISLAIALGLIFLLVVLGVLASFLRRKREGYVPAPTKVPVGAAGAGAVEPQTMQERLPPHEILSGLGQGQGRTGVGGAPMI